MVVPMRTVRMSVTGSTVAPASDGGGNVVGGTSRDAHAVVVGYCQGVVTRIRGGRHRRRIGIGC